ncbi:MAG: hypothetical protein ACUVTG_05725, partial [Candidatus Oleimicrobiaceae bacterium]
MGGLHAGLAEGVPTAVTEQKPFVVHTQTPPSPLAQGGVAVSRIFGVAGPTRKRLREAVQGAVSSS